MIKRKLFKKNYFNAGSKEIVEEEKIIENIDFNVFKFNDREKPVDKKNIVIFSCFSEFGCELVGAMYAIPNIIRKEASGKYKIAVGWYGREYFYRNLVDEFWEIKEENQWLREYCRAFHHDSKNLKKIEFNLSSFGRVYTSSIIGNTVIANKCLDCNHLWSFSKNNSYESCPKCESENIERSMFNDIEKLKNNVSKIKEPSLEYNKKALDYLKENSVGIFARGRKCYGRNLQPEFYVKLIELLRNMGYNPIWLGEKQTTLPCPVGDVIDFSRLPESRDLELTLAIIKNLKFTIQFWTASTRLSGIMGIPYILFESPDQIYGNGQEGYRRKLCDMGPSKLVVSHYKNVYEKNEDALKIVEETIKEVENNDFSVKVGLVESEMIVKGIIDENK